MFEVFADAVPRVPRMRGDDPEAMRIIDQKMQCSPHARG